MPGTSSRFCKHAEESADGPWFEVGLEEPRLLSAEGEFDPAPGATWTRGFGPRMRDGLGMCPACHGWDPSAINEAVDVVIDSQTRHGKRVTKNTIASHWVGFAIGSPIVLMNRRLLDALKEDANPAWLIGSVHDEGGAEIDGLVTLIDPAPVSQGTTNRLLRTKYSANVFNHFASRTVGACGECGRFSASLSNAWYLLSSEVRGQPPKIMAPYIAVPKRVVDRLELYSPAVWPNLRIRRIPTHDDLLDPLPAPLPVWWEEFEAYESTLGNVVPFPVVESQFENNPGQWMRRYAADRRERGLPASPPSHDEQRIATYLRLRGLWESRIGEKLAGLDEEELVRLVRHGLEHQRKQPPETWIGIEHSASKRRRH